MIIDIFRVSFEANILKAADKELMNLTRRDMHIPSTLSNRSYAGLCQENWMAEVMREMNTRYPTVANVLSTLQVLALL